MRASNPKRKRAQMLSALKQSYIREFTALSDYIYYSLIFEGSNGEMSRVFCDLCQRQIEIFKRVGRLIVNMGSRPALNTQLRQISSISEADDLLCIDEIERIFRGEAEKKRRSIEELTRIFIASENATVDGELQEIINDQKDILARLERVLNS